ncbi:MAG: DUF3574 domain-containing protein [Hyphomicrobiales bacterium]|nr:DUF3574 domain-containing protein [Alphaproteobacteria bacterium]
MRARAAAIVLIALATAADAEPALQCSGAQKPWVVADLLFGRTRVSEARWSRFLADEVTPRFPDGFTVVDARGQWRAPGSTRISRERSKVLTIAMPRNPENDGRLQSIVERYKTLFKQQSVGLIVRPACVSF